MTGESVSFSCKRRFSDKRSEKQSDEDMLYPDPYKEGKWTSNVESRNTVYALFYVTQL